MDAKLLKVAAVAAGAYVVVSWVMSARSRVALPVPKPPEPTPAPSPPEYPTDPFYCFEHPEDPHCEGLGI